LDAKRKVAGATLPAASMRQLGDDIKPARLDVIVQGPTSCTANEVIWNRAAKVPGGPVAPGGAATPIEGPASTAKAAPSKAPAGSVSVTLTRYPPAGAVCATAKDPVTVPVGPIMQVHAGPAANSPDPTGRLKVQGRVAPEGNPPPVIMIGPSRVPYPGVALFGDMEIVGPPTFWNPFTATAGRPTLGVTTIS